MYIILIYDIVTDELGSKILPKVFKICKKYLVPIQKSVFEGDLSDSQLMALKKEVGKHIRKNRDSLIIFKSRDKKWLQKEFWGINNNESFNFI